MTGEALGFGPESDPSTGSPAYCREETWNHELDDIKAFHMFLADTPEKWPFATTVILHNLVTASILAKFSQRKQRYFCIDDAAQELSANLAGSSSSRPDMRPVLPKLPSGIQLPGIGKHRLLSCPGIV